MSDKICTGYDGKTFTVGDRVELSPHLDLWMRGARFGTVVGVSLTPNDRVRVKVDKLGKRAQPIAGPQDCFRKV